MIVSPTEITIIDAELPNTLYKCNNSVCVLSYNLNVKSNLKYISNEIIIFTRV